jgi:hypothetical protein
MYFPIAVSFGVLEYFRRNYFFIIEKILNELQPERPSPDFSLHDSDKNRVALSNIRGQNIPSLPILGYKNNPGKC